MKTFTALGLAGGNTTEESNPVIRQAWLDCREALKAYEALVRELERMCRVYSDKHAGDGTSDAVCAAAYSALKLAKGE